MGELGACIRVRVSDHAELCVGHVIPGVEGVRYEYYDEKNDALTEEDLGKVSGALSIARGKRNPNDQG
jgi:hypothetical protein